MSYVRQGNDTPEGYLPLNPENAFDEFIALESDVSYYVSRFRAGAFSLDEQFSNRRKASSRNVAWESGNGRSARYFLAKRVLS